MKPYGTCKSVVTSVEKPKPWMMMVPKFVMPSPGATFEALLSPNYDWWANVSVTATEIFGGYFLALVIGVLLALVIGFVGALGFGASVVRRQELR